MYHTSVRRPASTGVDGRRPAGFPPAVPGGSRSQGAPAGRSRTRSGPFSPSGISPPCRFESGGLVTDGNPERADPKRPGTGTGTRHADGPPHRRAGDTAVPRGTGTSDERTGRTAWPARSRVGREPPLSRRSGRDGRPRPRYRSTPAAYVDTTVMYTDMSGPTRERSMAGSGRPGPCPDRPVSASACVLRASADPVRDQSRTGDGLTVDSAFRRVTGPRPVALS